VKGVAQAPAIAEEDINVMFATNVTGLINMTQAVLPTFKKRPDGGKGDIVNIGSIAGREPYQGGSIYCATKAAVRSFTDALRRELIATRIRIMEIDPGQVETEFSVVRFYGDKSKADAVYAGCEPLTPDDIAEVVVFAVGRRENVVIADTLIFPSHQVSATISWYQQHQLMFEKGGCNRCAQEANIRIPRLTARCRLVLEMHHTRSRLDRPSINGIIEESL
jgi:3-hydroxy acid dehydrogenase/malonic semialdehyde reductase